MALPCPGERAWTAPHPNAASSSRISTPLAGGGVREQAGQAVPRGPAAALPRGASPRAPSRVRPGALTVPASGPRVESRGADVGGAREGVLRIAGQAAGRVGGGHARPHGGPAARAARRSRASRRGRGTCRRGPRPARARTRALSASSKRVVGRPPAPAPQLEPRRARRQRQLHARRPRRAGRGAPRPACAAPAPRAATAALLEGRDLGLVEQVADVDAVGRRPTPRRRG